MKVRAKFKCETVTKHVGGERVELKPVYGGEANKGWSEYTPSGTIEMSITAKGAVGQFEPGKAYYVDFTPADEDD